MSDSFFFGDRALRRRAFLQVAGASAATATLVLAGCGTDDPTPITTTAPQIALGTADTGLLNYLFLLKQLKTAFYQKVVAALPADVPATEKPFFEDLRDHQLVHRETLRYVLGTTAYDAAAPTPLAFDFATLSLTTRAGVLRAAKQLEDLSVAAFAGALRFLKADASVALVLKMASADARHAAFVSDLLLPGSFAADDVVVSTDGTQSISVSKTPAQVVAEAKAFFLPYEVSTATLPTA